MNKILAILLGCILLVVVGFMTYRWVDTSIEESVQLEIQKMVDQENSNLPKLVAAHTMLEFIESHIEENDKRLVFKYRFDTSIPPGRFQEVESSTNQRILADRNAQRALKNGVRVFHQFQEPSGAQVLEFETRR
ncbi:MAG TPA: hypothetical protein PKD64_09730 [Pirellulaceae bacterium]|nr:hypothetical protein [Pirellulaceae bacterium]HMO92466.1 hypothetical protein [Pirellulaceae bacterium]HMP67864.1 hypothetical protein [Pirellulaceae bacterium]